jgi:hypothetical protein
MQTSVPRTQIVLVVRAGSIAVVVDGMFVRRCLMFVFLRLVVKLVVSWLGGRSRMVVSIGCRVLAWGVDT